MNEYQNEKFVFNAEGRKIDTTNANWRLQVRRGGGGGGGFKGTWKESSGFEGVT